MCITIQSHFAHYSCCLTCIFSRVRLLYCTVLFFTVLYYCTWHSPMVWYILSTGTWKYEIMFILESMKYSSSSPFYRWQNWDERNYSARVPQLVSGGTGAVTGHLDSKCCAFSLSLSHGTRDMTHKRCLESDGTSYHMSTLLTLPDIFLLKALDITDFRDFNVSWAKDKKVTGFHARQLTKENIQKQKLLQMLKSVYQPIYPKLYASLWLNSQHYFLNITLAWDIIPLLMLSLKVDIYNLLSQRMLKAQSLKHTL